MVDCMDTCKSLNISIVTVVRNPDIVKFVPDYLQTKKCVSMQLKNYLIF